VNTRPSLLGSLPLVALAACSDSAPPAAAPSACGGVELIVAASDYTSSVLCGAPGCVAGPGTTGADLGGDPMLATTNGRAFFLARDNDLVFELDAACGTPHARSSVHDLAPRNASTGEVRPANPHDAAAAPDGTVVVPLYSAARLAFLRDGKLDGSLDLASYDADGNPQADAVAIVPVDGRPKAFVTLERLDDHDLLRSKQTSQMLRVDVGSRAVEAAIDLAGQNPFNVMGQLDSALYLAEPGNFDAADDDKAGIERFDTATSTSKLLVHERDLGGSVAEVAVMNGCGAAIVAGPEKDVNPTKLVTFDPVTGKVTGQSSPPVLGPTPGYDLQGLAWRDQKLYVGDRRQSGAGYPVHILDLVSPSSDAGPCTLSDTGRTIDLPQRPVALRPATAAPPP
jgi:hypothetical protein